jgi:hypothetical protein
MALLVILLIILLIIMLALQRVSSNQGAAPSCSTEQPVCT